MMPIPPLDPADPGHPFRRVGRAFTRSAKKPPDLLHSGSRSTGASFRVEE